MITAIMTYEADAAAPFSLGSGELTVLSELSDSKREVGRPVGEDVGDRLGAELGSGDLTA